MVPPCPSLGASMQCGHKKGTPTLPQDPLSPIAEGSPTHSPPQCCGTSRCLCFAPRPFDQLWWQPSGPAVPAARVAAAVQLANVTYFQLPLIMQLHSQCCKSPPASRPAWWHCAGTGMLHCHRAGTSPGSSAAPGLGFSCPFCTALNSSPPQHHASVTTASPHASHGVPVSRVTSCATAGTVPSVQTVLLTVSHCRGIQTLKCHRAEPVSPRVPLCHSVSPPQVDVGAAGGLHRLQHR